MAFFGPKALGNRKNAKRVLPRKPRRPTGKRKYAPRGKPHKHRCPECKFLWPCSVATCRMSDVHVCVDCSGHYQVVVPKNKALFVVPQVVETVDVDESSHLAGAVNHEDDDYEGVVEEDEDNEVLEDD